MVKSIVEGVTCDALKAGSRGGFSKGWVKQSGYQTFLVVFFYVFCLFFGNFCLFALFFLFFFCFLVFFVCLLYLFFKGVSVLYIFFFFK